MLTAVWELNRVDITFDTALSAGVSLDGDIDFTLNGVNDYDIDNITSASGNSLVYSAAYGNGRYLQAETCRWL